MDIELRLFQAASIRASDSPFNVTVRGLQIILIN